MDDMNISAKETSTQSELRNFGLILAGGFSGFFGLLLPLLKGREVQLTSWPWLLSSLLLLASLAAPNVLGPLSKAWLVVGHVLGYINTRIILGIVFLAIFTPAALVLRLLGWDPLKRGFDKKLHSYRMDSRQPMPDNLNRPY